MNLWQGAVEQRQNPRLAKWKCVPLISLGGACWLRLAQFWSTLDHTLTPSPNGDDPRLWVMLQPRSSPLTLVGKGSSQAVGLVHMTYQQQFSKFPPLCGGRAVPTPFRMPDKFSDTGAEEIFINKCQCQVSFLLFQMSLLRECCLAPRAAQAWASLPISPWHTFGLSITSSILPWLVLFSLSAQGWNFPGWPGNDWVVLTWKGTGAPLRTEADWTACRSRWADLRKNKQGYHRDTLAYALKML